MCPSKCLGRRSDAPRAGKIDPAVRGRLLANRAMNSGNRHKAPPPPRVYNRDKFISPGRSSGFSIRQEQACSGSQQISFRFPRDIAQVLTGASSGSHRAGFLLSSGASPQPGSCRRLRPRTHRARPSRPATRCRRQRRSLAPVCSFRPHAVSLRYRASAPPAHRRASTHHHRTTATRPDGV
jgi:hypothetical protein